MYEQLKLSNQICFPLYVCSKEIVRKYKPYLDEIDLTYTQYITMMVFWERKEMNVKELGEVLFLDSGTLTPVLKKLEAKNFITRQRSKEDERNLVIKITQEGEALQEKCAEIPMKMGSCIDLSAEEAQLLHKILIKLENQFKE
ncbi:MAG: MarR family transcriptional regulator [Treponema sp.]|nr:MarR family transcriptional regulator [Candidatus Treponema equifaecale]